MIDMAKSYGSVIRSSTMKHYLLAIGLTLASGAQALAGDAGMAKVGDITIHDGWARASLGSASNSAAYMTVMVKGDMSDKLIAAASPVAESAELHMHIMDGDIAKMRPVEAIEVKPGEPATLEPGGFHVMLMGLKENLDAGGAVPLTLTFEQAGEVTLDVPVKALKESMKHGHDQKQGG